MSRHASTTRPHAIRIRPTRAIALLVFVPALLFWAGCSQPHRQEMASASKAPEPVSAKMRHADSDADGVPAQISPSMPSPVMVRPASAPSPMAMAQDAARIAPAPEFNTEEYAHIAENRFLSVAASPLSTFSIDVDTASYANTRRFLTGNQLPPADAVRIEELINYFRYAYPPPTGEHPFSVTADAAVCPWKPANRLVRIGLKAKDMETADLPPMNLVFLLDVSGSMDSPDKLPLLRQAFGLLVDQLRAKDKVAITVYAGAAGMVLPPTPGSEKTTIRRALDALQAGGSTAGAQGILLAYDTAEKNFAKGGNNRVILATDGDFNVGVSSEGELVRLIEEKREKGIFLTVLGFGTGNVKDSKMEQLADHGNGNYAYIDSLLEAKKVLASEMGGTLFTVAKDVKIQVEFNPAAVAAYRLVGYENRRLANEDFNDDKKDAGEMGAGHTVTALYEIVPVGGAVPGVDPLKYQKSAPATGDASELLTVKLRYKRPDESTSRLLSVPLPSRDSDRAFISASDDFRFAASVAGFGMLLRDSEHKGDLTWKTVIDTARAAKGSDPEGLRAEFVRLAETAEMLSPK